MSLLVPDTFGFEVTALVRAPGKKAAGSSPLVWVQASAHPLQCFLKGSNFVFIYCFSVFAFPPACALPQAPPAPPMFCCQCQGRDSPVGFVQ